AYQQGDHFFLEEHQKFLKYEGQLLGQGYSYDEVEKLRDYYREKVAETKKRETVLSKELRIGEAIWRDISAKEDGRVPQKEMELEGNKERVRDDGRKQPYR
ncbi:MAG TPA: relaxase, partial [Clostridiales bacterium]|nr:relaxase [Clostridiales bacterium]